MRAANVAGAASLGVVTDGEMRRTVIRDGVADFLVTSLDEALRILKNEIRKRQTVAVCVGGEPAAMEAEMRERGVLPDLRAPIAARSLQPDEIFLAVAEAPAKFEAHALALLPENALAPRRWLRHSARYLGPKARRVRSLACSKEMAALLTASY